MGGLTRSTAEFVAIDREWLPGEVASERWVKKAPASLRKTVALGADVANPARAGFTPPAPFFGKETYRRSSGKLTGSLGVSFLNLVSHPLTAVLEDEDLRRGRRSGAGAAALMW